MTIVPAVGDKFRSIILGSTYVVNTIKDKMVVLKRHYKGLRKDKNRGNILPSNSVYRPLEEYYIRPLKEYFKERRKYPRVHMNLPLEYRMEYEVQTHGAILIDASEGGFLIDSIKEIPIGKKLEISVLFSAEYELAKFEVLAEVIRKNVDVDKWDVEKGEEGHQYGLKFIQILGEDYWKLRRLLSGRFE